MRPSTTAGLALLCASATLLADLRQAEACGCLSPPAPGPVTGADYAVNQSAEQIIFEVEPNWVTAHVLIKYAGAPESFAWIVPVPEAPTELDVSPVSAFGLIDRASAPQVTVTSEDVCPISEWRCRYHAAPQCGGFGADGLGEDNGGGAPGFADAGASGENPPVTVIDEQIVGDYQTVTFRADEAGAAVTWLRTNGFIVNQTTSIYMEPYVQAGMVFVAAKLVAGAGVDAIRPLKMKYRSAYPMVPLVLTAVAAEPHLTVTSFIYGQQSFRPMNHPLATIDATRIARDGQGRLNYPMVLARTVDEAGGDAFVVEYGGSSPRTTFENNFCCSSGFDVCGIGGNTQCECPNAEFEQNDCAAVGDIVEGAELVDALAQKYPVMTRLTTRVSAEEMTFDPQFEVDFSGPRNGALRLAGNQKSLQRCASDVIDRTAFNQLQAAQDCAALYCGPAGRCVTTAAGPGCACDDTSVAQRFFDLDSQASVTCVPETPPVDLRAGGEVLPDACANINCGTGSCIDRNGVAVCECNPGTAAIAGAGNAPRCVPVVVGGETPGAQDFSDALVDLDVCAPAPPSCGDEGWLVKVGSSRPGVACANTEPSEAAQTPPPPPTCDGWFEGCAGCGASTNDNSGPITAIGSAWLLAFVLFRRRRGTAS